MQSVSNFSPLLLLKYTDNMHTIQPWMCIASFLLILHTDSFHSHALCVVFPSRYGLSHTLLPALTTGKLFNHTTTLSCTHSLAAHSSSGEHVHGQRWCMPPPSWKTIHLQISPMCNGEVHLSEQISAIACLHSFKQCTCTPHLPHTPHFSIISPVSLHLLFQTPRHPCGPLK